MPLVYGRFMRAPLRRPPQQQRSARPQGSLTRGFGAAPCEADALGDDGNVPGGPEFSVIIPVYNKVRHVEEAIDSVLAQTYGDFEIIAIDDASTDGSRDVLEAISAPRVRLLRRDEPGPGGYAARNLGVSVARGEWITFLDADDTWADDRLERLREAICAFPDANIHACGWFVATRDGRLRPNKYGRLHGAKGVHRASLSHYLGNLRRNRPMIHTDTVALRRSSLPDANVFPANAGLRRGGDGYAWLRVMCRERGLIWSPHLGARYYVDSDNMVTRSVVADVESFSRTLIEELEPGLSASERRLLRRAANGLLWSNWLNEALLGRRGFALRQRLFWRGAWRQALPMAIGSLVPKAVIRGVRRLVKLSSPAG